MQFLTVLLSLTPALATGVQAVAVPSLQEETNVPNNTMVHAFTDTCDTPDLSPSGKHFLLWAGCQQKDRKVRCTRLDMDKCYGDDNGKIVARKDGKLSDHCSGCRLGSGNRALGCVCKEKPNQVVWVTLDDLIGNDDGFLTCHGYRGTETCGQ